MLKESFYELETFERMEFSNVEILGKKFESCTFSQCNFANGSLSSSQFIDCTFKDCDWSMIKLADTGLKGVHFLNCKMIGIDFESCNDILLSISFENCMLDYASFYKKNLSNTVFENCKMEETNFTEANLKNASFKGCNLVAAVFENTILESTDFRTAINYNLDPEKNRMKKAKFSLEGVLGLLGKYKIEVE